MEPSWEKISHYIQSMSVSDWLVTGFFLCLVILYVCGVGLIFMLPFPTVAKVAITALCSALIFAFFCDMIDNK